MALVWLTADNLTSASNIADMVWLVIVCVLVIVVCFFVTKYVGTKHIGASGGNFRVIDSYMLGNGKSLQLVKAGGKYIVIAVMKDTIQFIAEVSEADVVLRKGADFKKINFADIFGKFVKPGKAGIKDDIDDKVGKDDDADDADH